MIILDGKRLPTVTPDHILGFFGEYRFLSNYHLAPLLLDGLVYPSSEHAYMAQKCQDIEVRRHISELPSPKDAREYGQTVPLSANWPAERVDAMYRVLTAKFEYLPLRALLLATKNKHLEETNNWGDQFWGVVDGVGQSQLGLSLMRVRADIQRHR